ncbi:hypothetical protein BH10PSE19_BH10PSE19_15890 [soil metagenome]
MASTLKDYLRKYVMEGDITELEEARKIIKNPQDVFEATKNVKISRPYCWQVITTVKICSI